jgi:para-aminobenzoate synthetase component 1
MLVGRPDGWELATPGGVVDRWPTLTEALRTLGLGDGGGSSERPSAVGWFGFGACAELGGGLPARSDGDDLRGALLLEPGPMSAAPILNPGRPAAQGRGTCSFEDDEFAAGVSTIRGAIRDGRVYQVNLCRRFSWPWVGGLEPLVEALAAPPPDYLATMSWDAPEPGEMVCASMERLLRLDGDRASIGPIKGSRGRGATPADDRRAVEELRTDPKECAELAMIVDLERNDLGRVAQIGSVRVDDPGSVRTYASIHHRVADVSARVRRHVPWWEVLASVVPGGSVTGCPKHAAMTMIREVEPVARGPFTGAFGVVGGSGDLEMALPIRTAWTWRDRLHIGAGCGVVWDSDPWAEVRESRLKIAPWLRALGGSA